MSLVAVNGEIVVEVCMSEWVGEGESLFYFSNFFNLLKFEVLFICADKSVKCAPSNQTEHS